MPGKVFYTAYLTRKIFGMYKTPIIPAAFLVFLLSCKNDVEIIQLRAVDESLRNATTEIQRDNKWICQAMEEKLKDPQTKAKAEIWQPKAAEIKRLSDAMVAYIDTLETGLKKQAGLNDSSGELHNDKKIVSALFSQQGHAAELSAKLAIFKRVLIETLHPEDFAGNPYFQKDLVNYANKLQLTILTDVHENHHGMQTMPPANADPIQNYFINSSAWAAIAILDKMKNDIARAENNILNYLNSMIAVIYHGYERFSAIVTQNSNYLKKGQLLEIYAGMGSFSDASKPTITINGTNVPPGDDAVSTYHLKITGKPGKYFIPVKINFTSPDGSLRTLKRKIMYTVGE